MRVGSRIPIKISSPGDFYANKIIEILLGINCIIHWPRRRLQFLATGMIKIFSMQPSTKVSYSYFSVINTFVSASGASCLLLTIVSTKYSIFRQGPGHWLQLLPEIQGHFLLPGKDAGLTFSQGHTRANMLARRK